MEKTMIPYSKICSVVVVRQVRSTQVLICISSKIFKRHHRISPNLGMSINENKLCIACRGKGRGSTTVTQKEERQGVMELTKVITIK